MSFIVISDNGEGLSEERTASMLATLRERYPDLTFEEVDACVESDNEGQAVIYTGIYEEQS